MSWKKSSRTFAPARRWSRNFPTSSAPALLLWGRKDRLIDVSSVAIWSKGIADLRVEIWDGIGHMPMVEAPASTARLYREFLASQALGKPDCMDQAAVLLSCKQSLAE